MMAYRRWCPEATVNSNAVLIDDFEISFHRTLRISDSQQHSKLPPSFGRFPLYDTRKYVESLPLGEERKGGIFIPMYRKLS
jgi:hypothetical protein